MCSGPRAASGRRPVSDGLEALRAGYSASQLLRHGDPPALQLERPAAGLYAPTDYDPPLDTFPLPAPSNVTATNFTPFLGTAPNGSWLLLARDDLGGDGGTIANGWTVTIERQDTPPLLNRPQFLPDGRFQATLTGLPRMTHVVEASADLVTWEPVSTNTFTARVLLTLTPPPGAPPHRFYRATRCP